MDGGLSKLHPLDSGMFSVNLSGGKGEGHINSMIQHIRFEEKKCSGKENYAG